MRELGPLSGQFSPQSGQAKGRGPHSLPQPVPGEDQAAGCSTAQPWQTLASATTEVLKRRLAETSSPGDLILFKAKCHPVKKTTGFPASWTVVAHSVCSAWS